MPSKPLATFIVLTLLGVVMLAAAVLAPRARNAAANPQGGIASIGPGEAHSCAVTTVGGVKCWGGSGFAALGDGTLNSSPIPVDVSGLASGVAAISAGSLTSCALTTSGGVQCWGNDSGDGTYGNRLTPVDVVGLSSGVDSTSVGGSYSCAVKSAALWCWGGLAGITQTSTALTPVAVLPSGVAAVAAGTAHICILTTSGGVQCVGSNEAGELGDGSKTDRTVPVSVVGLGSGAIAIGAGYKISCALTTDGGVSCWGEGYGNTPVVIPGLTDAVALAVGGFHACALTSIGTVKCWGSNTSGQLGDGEQCGSYCLVAVDVQGLPSGIVSIAAGLLHACAVTATNFAYCWGDDHSGQLGDGDSTGIKTLPTAVVQSAAKPTPTPTSCGGPCPTPTPTSTPSPRTAPDFSIAVGGQCDSTLGPAKCSVATGRTFTLAFKLDSIPSNFAYATYDAGITYAGVDLVPNSLVQLGPGTWPPCVFAASNFDTRGLAAFGCVYGIGASQTTYTGVMAHLDFRCPSAPGIGVLTLLHNDSDVVSEDFSVHYEGGPDESLMINCVAPQPYPIDTDGDGCPDAKEAGLNPMSGGLRDFLNPWDYFNPTHDGQNRVDDVLAVVQHYGLISSNAGYSTAYDRTYLGPNPWNLGPPDGKIRIDDIMAIIHQYGHDCD